MPLKELLGRHEDCPADLQLLRYFLLTRRGRVSKNCQRERGGKRGIELARKPSCLSSGIIPQLVSTAPINANTPWQNELIFFCILYSIMLRNSEHSSFHDSISDSESLQNDYTLLLAHILANGF